MELVSGVAPRWSPVLQSIEGEQHKDREVISERERGCHGGIENVEGTMRDSDIHRYMYITYTYMLLFRRRD